MSGGWNTIESDAGVFTYLMENLGVQGVQFEELMSLDADSLRILSPIYGLIFLFKYPTDTSSAAAARDGAPSPDAGERLWFAHQTIQNACATQALLSVLLNQDSRVEIGPTLRSFKEFTSSFPPDLRGEALSNSDPIREVHNSFARSSPFVDETQRPADGDDDVYHFVAYAALDGTLFELDGLQSDPLAHGACTDEQFADKVIKVLQARVARYPEGEIRFNVLAMVGDLRQRAREFGDTEALRQEEEKRRAWMWENALRRHNFVGFTGEVLRAVVGEKVKKGEYQAWVKEGTEMTTRQMDARRARRAQKGQEG